MDKKEMIPDKANLPLELVELKQFILWFEEGEGEKRDKVPAAPWSTGHWKAASPTDPSNWTDFNTALEYAGKKEGYGIGFSFKPEGGLVGIDLDNCIAEEKIDEKASKIIKDANSYAEISPSGRGVHILMKGILPGVIKNDKEHVEVYDRDRYFTLTGRRCTFTPAQLSENYGLLEKLYKKYGTKTEPIMLANNEKKTSILTVLNAEGMKQVGDRLQGPHPVHGSTTGMNFSVNVKKNVWFCYRHWVGGGPVSLFAMQRAMITCEDLKDGKLRGDTLEKVLEAAQAEGLIADTQKKVAENELLSMIKEMKILKQLDSETSYPILLDIEWNGSIKKIRLDAKTIFSTRAIRSAFLCAFHSVPPALFDIREKTWAKNIINKLDELGRVQEEEIEESTEGYVRQLVVSEIYRSRPTTEPKEAVIPGTYLWCEDKIWIPNTRIKEILKAEGISVNLRRVKEWMAPYNTGRTKSFRVGEEVVRFWPFSPTSLNITLDAISKAINTQAEENS